ncbi:MAG: hypothetical protein EGQ57_07195 [Alphaproteobacteria bacterium]|nr:hypothetical protein [Alphaproteobacteria bacterium]
MPADTTYPWLPPLVHISASPRRPDNCWRHTAQQSYPYCHSCRNLLMPPPTKGTSVSLKYPCPT